MRATYCAVQYRMYCSKQINSTEKYMNKNSVWKDFCNTYFFKQANQGGRIRKLMNICDINESYRRFLPIGQSSVADPDPYWIRIRWATNPGSGSVFRYGIIPYGTSFSIRIKINWSSDCIGSFSNWDANSMQWSRNSKDYEFSNRIMFRTGFLISLARIRMIFFHKSPSSEAA